MRVHFIGIGGVGVSALAEVALARGDIVSGSDRSASPITDRLERRGAHVAIGHSADIIRETRPELVVYSAAIPETNPERAAAKADAIPTMSRSRYLGLLMDQAAPPRIAIAGTHGKTTTTCMVGSVLTHLGLDPTVLIGGDYAPFGGNTRPGHGPVVTEACEAFRSFLDLRPDIAVITNVEKDHLDCYGDLDGVVAGFTAFIAGMRPGGTLVLWADDPRAPLLRTTAEAHGLGVLGYGIGSGPDRAVWAECIEETAEGVTATVLDVPEMSDGRSPIRPAASAALKMHVPGVHNVLNALAAIGVAKACQARLVDAAAALNGFGGVERRFEILGTRAGVTVVDDYAHHPTEIAATIAAARGAFPGRRLIVVFQPHLYSRTRDLLDEFAVALSGADCVIVAGIYAAREDPIPGVTPTLLADRLAREAPDKTVLVEADKKLIPDVVERISMPGDVLLVVGAGDIREAGEAFLKRATVREE